MTIKQKVEDLLDRNDERGYLCRNNDNFLILCYINTFHKDLKINLESDLDNKVLCALSNKLPALSEIKRIRAHFQNNLGLYQAEEKVIKQRNKLSEEKRLEYLKIKKFEVKA